MSSLKSSGLIYITFVAKRMIRMMMIRTITPIIIIILMFFHQYFLATREDVLWNESADACRPSVLPMRSSNLSPRSSTLLMLSFRITFTSFTWPCTWSSLVGEAVAGDWKFGSAISCEKIRCRPTLSWYVWAKGSVCSPQRDLQGNKGWSHLLLHFISSCPVLCGLLFHQRNQWAIDWELRYTNTKLF